MSTTNRDASLTTARRRQLALVGWRRADNYGSGGAPTTVKSEQTPSNGNQGVGPSGIVATEVYLGAQLIGQANAGCNCSSSVTLQGYSKNSPAC